MPKDKLSAIIFNRKICVFKHLPVIKYKQGNENAIVDALSWRYALLTTLQSKLLGFELIKDLYENDAEF